MAIAITSLDRDANDRNSQFARGKLRFAPQSSD
jgi:hypothetical protein